MEISIVVALVGALGLLLLAFIGTVFARSARARPTQPGWQPSPPVPAAAGIWHAEVLGTGLLGRLGGTLGSTFGELRLDQGVLTFLPEGQTSAAWSCPCVELWARKDSAVALNGADLTLRGPMGDLRCNVSTERINRLTRNPFKDLRERGYADQFLLALRAHGSQIG